VHGVNVGYWGCHEGGRRSGMGKGEIFLSSVHGGGCFVCRHVNGGQDRVGECNCEGNLGI